MKSLKALEKVSIYAIRENKINSIYTKDSFLFVIILDIH